MLLHVHERIQKIIVRCRGIVDQANVHSLAQQGNARLKSGLIGTPDFPITWGARIII